MGTVVRKDNVMVDVEFSWETDHDLDEAVDGARDITEPLALNATHTAD